VDFRPIKRQLKILAPYNSMVVNLFMGIGYLMIKISSVHINLPSPVICPISPDFASFNWGSQFLVYHFNKRYRK